MKLVMTVGTSLTRSSFCWKNMTDFDGISPHPDYTVELRNNAIHDGRDVYGEGDGEIIIQEFDEECWNNPSCYYRLPIELAVIKMLIDSGKTPETVMFIHNNGGGNDYDVIIISALLSVLSPEIKIEHGNYGNYAGKYTEIEQSQMAKHAAGYASPGDILCVAGGRKSIAVQSAMFAKTGVIICPGIAVGHRGQREVLQMIKK